MPVDVAKMSLLITEMMADDEDDVQEIPLANVDKVTLEKVVEYCKHHAVPGNPQPKIDRPIRSTKMSENVGADYRWDADFIDAVAADHEKLFNLVLAANYLNIELLLDLGCAKIASMLKNKTPQQVREEFGIAEPTPEEEEQIRKENQWIFDIRPIDAPTGAAAGGAAAAST